jgi:CelD/BcsL family acetyltransferase involved in cellulose biosynthesis
VRVRRLTSLRDFDALAAVWADVTRESGQQSPFLSHDWFACCWRTAGLNRRREVWIIEDAAGPVALIPLMRQRARLRGLPVRIVSFLDSPDTPFTEFVVAGRHDEVVARFLDTLSGDRDWDLFSMGKLRADSMTWKALELALGGRPWRVAAREQAPYLRVSGTWEEFFRRKTQRFRKTCRHIENRIRRGGAVTVEEHRHADPEGPLLAEVMEVSFQSWKGPQGLAMATMQGMPRFFKELTARASARGWLHLWILRLDGRPVATEYQLGCDGQIHALRADFDHSLADLSPGAYLNQWIVRSLFESETVDEYQMGPGTNEYKLRWATGAHETLSIQLFAPRPYGRILHGIESRLVPLVRRVRSGAAHA